MEAAMGADDKGLGITRIILGVLGLALLLYSIRFYRDSLGFTPPEPLVTVDSAAVLVPMSDLMKLATEEATFQALSTDSVTADVDNWFDGHYLLVTEADYLVRFGFDAGECLSCAVSAGDADGLHDTIVLQMPPAEVLSIEMVTSSFRIEARDLRTCSARDVDNSFEARIPDILDSLRAGLESQIRVSQGYARAQNNFVELAEAFYGAIGFEDVEVRFE
jgi:hypothetical protein